MRPVCLITVSEGCWSFILTKLHQNTLALEVICLGGLGTISNLAKVGIIPCICTAALSLLDSRVY